jgi:hypothetical protein
MNPFHGDAMTSLADDDEVARRRPYVSAGIGTMTPRTTLNCRANTVPYHRHYIHHIHHSTF